VLSASAVNYYNEKQRSIKRHAVKYYLKG